MNRDREILCGGFALVITTVVFVLCLQVPALTEIISAKGNLNMLLYAGCLFLFCILLLLGMCLTGSWTRKGPVLLEKTGFKKVFARAVCLLACLFLIVMMFLETGQASTACARYAWHTLPEPISLLVFLSAFLFFLAIIAAVGSRRIAHAELLIWLMYVLLALLVFWSMYTVNLFGRQEWTDWYHGYAYYNSVYNVLHGVPFSGEVTSIYGHYALLYLLPMKLLGGSMKAFVFLQAMLTAAAHLLAFATLRMLVKSRLLQVLGAVALTFVTLGMRAGYYWQVWPHRIVFPILLLFYITLLIRKNRLGLPGTVIGYGICALAILWNTETGLVLAAALALLRISMNFSGQKKLWNRLLVILLNLAAAVAAFLAAYALVAIYNRMNGGTANSLREFLIPLTSSSYVTDILHLDLPLYPSAYMAEVLLFLVGTVFGVSEWRFFRRKGPDRPMTWQNQLILFLSVSALGRLIYYMNRPAYHNLDCCHFSAVLLLTCLAGKALPAIREKRLLRLHENSFTGLCRELGGLLCLIAVFFMAGGTLVQYGENNYLKEGYRDEASLQDYLQQVAEEVPENTFAFGMNVPLLYSYLHWDTGYYGMDYSDISVIPGEAARTIEAIREAQPQAVLTSFTTLPSLEKFDPEGYAWFCDNYELEKNFDLTDEAFLYYVQK